MCSRNVRARLHVLLSLVLQGMSLSVRKTAASQSYRPLLLLPVPPFCTSGCCCTASSTQRMQSRRRGCCRPSFSSTRWFRTSVRLSRSDQPSLAAPIFNNAIPLLDDTTTTTPCSSPPSHNDDTLAKTTRYTIDYCPRTDPIKLQYIVDKHVTTLDRYLTHKPIAQHTVAAYQELCRQLRLSKHSPNTTTTTMNHGRHHSIVLDSGCGTGRSSLALGRLYPQYTVVGVDRSVARLSKQTKHGVFWGTDDDDNSEDNGHGNVQQDDNGVVLVQQVASNVWLVRAELTDFWRLLLLQQQPQQSHMCHNDNELFDDTQRDTTATTTTTTTTTLTVVHHYLLYPNPYPKQVRLNQRWYAHASFPILLQVLLNCSGGGGGSLTVRSNWRQYLEEFCAAYGFYQSSVAQMDSGNNDSATTNMSWTISGPVEIGPSVADIIPTTAAWTNFEEKYWLVGERTYELVVQSTSLP
jgi:hypothetical protein